MHKRVDDPLRSGDESARSAVAFVAELTGELSVIARHHRFDALAYLLDMARLEAENLRRELHIKDN
jgi:hypothetical protein